MKYLDNFEKDILKSVESGEWKSKNNKEERYFMYYGYTKASLLQSFTQKLRVILG